MLLFFLLVACSVVASFPELGLLPSAGFQSAPLTLASTVTVIFAYWAMGRAMCARLVEAIIRERYRRVMLLRTGYLALLVAAYATILSSCHWVGMLQSVPIGELDWPGVIGAATLDDIPIAGYLLRLAPALVLIAAALHALYEVDRHVRSGVTLRGYMNFNLRLVMAPLPLLVLMLLLQDGMDFASNAVPEVDRALFMFPSVQILVLVVLLVIVASIFPLFMRIVFQSRRLPDGPLRQRLEAIARETGVRYRDILVWRTGSFRLPNAMVTGIWPRLRFIFITDVLLSHMSQRELEAVFAHELGHARYNHLRVFMLALVGFVCISFGVLDPVISGFAFSSGVSADVIATVTGLTQLAVLALFFVTMLAVVNPRFERQADLYAVQHAPPGALEDALLSINMLVGGHMRKRPSVTHGSIDQRVQFILSARALPASIDATMARTTRLIRGIYIAVILAVLAPAWITASEAMRAPVASEVYDVLAPLSTADVTLGQLNAAIADLQATREEHPGEPYAHFYTAVLLEDAGPTSQADWRLIADAYRQAVKTGGASPYLRLQALYRLEAVEYRLRHWG